ncbi:hypothetical protein [Staphylococcus gallinarum]|nr:hypothetical protein [Staphylococcus gallinarum]MCD8829546.1 hypothetical protein [Staphylococcus gallinarum]MEB6237348.1 hypothetical protein [Staphylococcus gallinarum]MEB7040227.1 hypothetical protein [Staphylococcus gallinarum]PTK97001.1 hypothetical protein BUZ05_00525 [Staphylococcus gallinarum]
MGNTLLYLRNDRKEPINSRVIAISNQDYINQLTLYIEDLIKSVGANVNVIRFIVLEINDIKSLHLDAVCIVSRVLEMIIGTKVIVTNDINSFDYDKYLRTA